MVDKAENPATASNRAAGVVQVVLSLAGIAIGRKEQRAFQYSRSRSDYREGDRLQVPLFSVAKDARILPTRCMPGYGNSLGGVDGNRGRRVGVICRAGRDDGRSGRYAGHGHQRAGGACRNSHCRRYRGDARSAGAEFHHQAARRRGSQNLSVRRMQEMLA